MKKLRYWSALLALCLGWVGTPVAQQETLRVGVIPYLTPNVLIALFQPLRLQLEKDTGQPVALFTAPDVRSFARRTLKPDFDLIITAAHQARLAAMGEMLADFIAKRPDVAKRFAAVWAKALDLIKRDPQEARKHLLEYDDVMNKQRENIYALRRQILEGRLRPRMRLPACKGVPVIEDVVDGRTHDRPRGRGCHDAGTNTLH